MTTATVEGFRLSPQQLRVWALQEQDGESVYRTRGAIHIEGELDPARLRRALERVIERHEILRTTFRRLPGMGTPLQAVREEAPALFDEPQKGEGFDLADGPVWSAVVRRAAGGGGTLRLDLPALCADRSTLERFAVEIAELYETDGEAGAPLGEPLQYADVSEWLNELLEKPESARGIEYWRRLDPPETGSRLPFEKAADPRARFDPARVPVPISAETGEGLERLCRELGSTPRIFLLTCWQILLQRLTGDANVVIACGTDGRRLEELKTAMGLCSRYLPLRGALDEASFLPEALSRVAGAVDEQEKWQDLFTWNLRPREAGGERPIPYFPFCFEFAARSESRAGALRFRLAEELACTDRFDLRLSCTRTDAGVSVELDYDSSRLGPEEAERLAARFARTVESAVSSPRVPLGRIEILPEEERRKLISEWNDTAREFPDARPLHERFEEAAAQTPDDVALVYETRRLSFSELNARANQIAHELRGAGVGPESLVGLSVERSVEMIVGLLAIWKAGGAYVPFDPSLPAERLAFLLQDTGAAFLLTRSTLAHRFPACSARIFFLDGESHGARTNPERSARPENLAYVIFTSGSTGRPKGVAVEHRQISNYVNGIVARLDPPRGASFATVTTLAADLGNTSIFPSLATGGRLHVIPEETSSNPDVLAQEFDREPVDYLKIVPSHLAALLSASRPERILPRRRLILGGEPSSWELIDRILRLKPSCEILNHYGPTEATIGATTFRVASVPVNSRSATVPVGRPLPNCRVFLSDSRGQPVPVGVPGELAIGGAGLARGYLNRPELTAERFVEWDLGYGPERVYRTGDLGRYLSDGNIELLGRTDDQVKLHGFRIEPGEIEAALRQHSGVRETVVLPREIAGAGKRLIAYVVPEPSAAPGSAELRRHLLGKLPDFMLPSAFVFLSRLPLTPNGKIDRAALPLPDPSRPDDGEPLVAPRTPQERVLFQVWADVLRVERFGVHDNFFELGGDSILAIQIIARAARGGLRLTPRQVFERQTVAELAEVAESSLVSEGDQETVAGPVPLTPIQRWFFALDLLDPHQFNQSVLLEFPEAADAGAMEKAVALLAHHHDALRLRFIRTADGWRQTNSPSESGPVFSVVPVGHLSDSDRPSAMEEAAAAAQRGLNLSEGPLFRAVLFDRGPADPARLLLIVHHLAVDGVSWRILLEDLENAYRRIREGQPPALPPKTTSFQKWAEKLADLAGSGSLEREAAYWLAGTERTSRALPLDAHGENTLGSARVVVSEFTEEETRTLLQEVPAVYRTQINDALLAALTEAFTKWTGGRTLRIDLEGHGREDIFPGVDLSRTVGWFTARFPVLLELPESSDPGEMLIAVKEQVRAIPQRGIGYGILRYLADGGAGTRWKSLPDPPVSFNYLGQLDRPVEENSPVRVLPPIGAERSPRDRRPHLLSVEGNVREGRLRFAWVYSENLHHRETIARLADGFEQAVRRLLAHCLSAGGPARYTPSDFPSARLSQKDLNKLLAGVQNADPRSRR